MNIFQDWYCPNCSVRDRTAGFKPNRYHTCSNGILAPLLLEGTAAKVEIRMREDYVGKEHVQLFNGKPVMSVVTTRDDGMDAIVFAPTATGRST